MRVFWLFLKNGSNDFGQNAPACRTNQYWTARENRMPKFCSVLEIFIHKVSILAKNGESGVQRSLYILRTVNAMENLIWYSESTKNYLSQVCHPFFHSSSSSMRKFDPKTVNFECLFEWFLGIFSSTTWDISMKLGQKSDKMDKKQLQKTAGQYYQPSRRFLGSKMAKIDQNRPNFMNDPNFGRKIFYCIFGI